jgi:hypothetical protein
VALQRVQAATILSWAVVWLQERPVLGSVSFQVFLPSLCMTCFVLLVMGLGPRFLMFSPLRAPHVVFCNLGCDVLFGIWSFLFSSLVPLVDVFPLFIYLIYFQIAHL